jgi:hypothetical protein
MKNKQRWICKAAMEAIFEKEGTETIKPNTIFYGACLSL